MQFLQFNERITDDDKKKKRIIGAPIFNKFVFKLTQIIDLNLLMRIGP